MPNQFESEKVAAHYDDFYKEKTGKVYDDLEKKAIKKLLNGCIIKKILEIGCGTGHWTEFFADLGYNIVAIDSSNAMLEIAKRKNIKNTVFIKDNAETIELENMIKEKFDAVVFITSLEFMDNPKKAFENCIRFVRPGGYAILGILNANSYLGKQRKLEKGLFTDAHFFTEEELMEFLSPYGEVLIIHSAYAAPHEIEEAYKIEQERSKKGEKTGNFMAVRVDLKRKN